MESVLIWGAGEHGRVVAEIARAAGCHVAGFIARLDPDSEASADADGVVIDEEELIDLVLGGHDLPLGATAVVSGVANNRVRWEHASMLGALLAAPIVHPSAVISPSATLQPGTVVCPMAAINTNASVGRAVIVNTGAIVGHDCTVGDGAHISSRAVLAGGAQVGMRAFVAAGAIVLPRVRVGADVTIGAGAVVRKNLADGVTAAGVPARLIEGSRHGRKQSHLSISPPPIDA